MKKILDEKKISLVNPLEQQNKPISYNIPKRRKWLKKEIINIEKALEFYNNLNANDFNKQMNHFTLNQRLEQLKEELESFTFTKSKKEKA